MESPLDDDNKENREVETATCDDDKFEGVCLGPMTEVEKKWKISKGLMVERDGEYFDVST